MVINERDQYRVETRERGNVIDRRTVPDPFVTTTIRLGGWRNALSVLMGHYTLSVTVDGTREAQRVVYTGDYSPFVDTTEAPDFRNAIGAIPWREGMPTAAEVIRKTRDGDGRIDEQVGELPTMPKETKPSELIRSLPEDHWGTEYLKMVVKDGYVWCSAGWLLECAGVIWHPDDERVSVRYAVRADGRAILPSEAAALCGLTQVQYLEVARLNDRDGREAVIRYLETIGK